MTTEEQAQLIRRIKDMEWAISVIQRKLKEGGSNLIKEGTLENAKTILINLKKILNEQK